MNVHISFLANFSSVVTFIQLFTMHKLTNLQLFNPKIFWQSIFKKRRICSGLLNSYQKKKKKERKLGWKIFHIKVSCSSLPLKVKYTKRSTSDETRPDLKFASYPNLYFLCPRDSYRLLIKWLKNWYKNSRSISSGWYVLSNVYYVPLGWKFFFLRLNVK